jgi:hypothetical protein
MRRHRITEEEKVAQKMIASVSDLRLDIESIGEYLADVAPYVSYNRIQEIAEAAKFHRVKCQNKPATILVGVIFFQTFG